MQMVDSYVEKFSKWRDKLNSRFEQVEKSTQVLDIMDGLWLLMILEIHTFCHRLCGACYGFCQGEERHMGANEADIPAAAKRCSHVCCLVPYG